MPAAQFVIGTLNIKAVMPCLATAREARASMRRRPNCGQKLSSIGCRLPDSMLCQSPLVLPGVVQNDCPEPLSQSELATKPADKASQEHPPHPCWTRPQVHLTNACARCDCAQSRACVQQGRSRKHCSWMVRYVWPTCLGLLLMQGRAIRHGGSVSILLVLHHAVIMPLHCSCANALISEHVCPAASTNEQGSP